jgi:hypothetical protein
MAADLKLKNKVEQALRKACENDQDVEIRLDDVEPDRIGGLVLSVVFEPLSPTDRQDLIWQFLDDALTTYERTRISFIVTDTPREYAVLTGSD